MKLDAAAETERIASFVRKEIREAGRSRVVLGLSGGIDSALVAFLCVRAIGKENVLAFLLPYRTSSPQSSSDALAVSDLLGIKAETIDITPAVDALKAALRPADPLRLGNLTARTRMIALYDRSAAHNAVVAGTGNRTESMLGYTTLHGDSACGFAPILHLYKCQVRQLAEYLDVPGHVIRKTPTADLWQGQTDEAELGFTYDEADWLLFNMLDRRKSDAELEAMGFGRGFVARVKQLAAKSEFKRRMPHSLLEGQR